MKTRSLFAVSAVALLLLFPSFVHADRSLAIVLDRNRDHSDEPKVAIAFINDVMANLASKSPLYDDLSVTLVQSCALPPSSVKKGLHFSRESRTRRVHDTDPFSESKVRPDKQSPIDKNDNTRTAFWATVANWEVKADGVILISSANGASAHTPTGGRFYQLVIPPYGGAKLNVLDNTQFVQDIMKAVDSFLDQSLVPELSFTLVTKGEVVAGSEAVFSYESRNVDRMVVKVDDKEVRSLTQNLAKGTVTLPFGAEGSHVVTATGSRHGQDVMEKAVKVAVVPPPPPPEKPEVRRLSFSPASPFATDMVDFDIALSHDVVAKIDFGEGPKVEWRSGTHATHTYSKEGAYKVAVTPDGGIPRTAIVSVSAPKVTTLSVEPHAPAAGETATVTVLSTGATSVRLDFGDKSPAQTVAVTSDRATATHVFKAGSYRVKAIPVRGGQEFGAMPHDLEVSRPSAVPKVSLSAEPAQALVGQTVTFSLSLENADHAEIDFGDGSERESHAPGEFSHVFAGEGIPEVVAKAVSSDGIERSVKCPVTVVRPEAPAPTCGIAAEERVSVKKPYALEVVFTNTTAATVRYIAPDGTSEEPVPVDIGAEGKASIRRPSGFDAEGIWTVAIEFANGDGKTAEQKHSVEAFVPVQKFGGAKLTVNGMPVKEQGSVHVIPVGETVVVEEKDTWLNVVVSVDYGEGNGPETMLEHRYDRVGDYTIVVQPKGKYGKKFDSDKISIRVEGGGSLFPIILAILLLGGGGFVVASFATCPAPLSLTENSNTQSIPFSRFRHECEFELSDGTVLTAKGCGRTHVELSAQSPGVMVDGDPVPVRIAKGRKSVIRTAGGKTAEIQLG